LCPLTATQEALYKSFVASNAVQRQILDEIDAEDDEEPGPRKKKPKKAKKKASEDDDDEGGGGKTGKSGVSTLSAITTLKKLCNHPDLILDKVLERAPGLEDAMQYFPNAKNAQ
jgi:SNF2 family DNA or RNA helicase